MLGVPCYRYVPVSRMEMTSPGRSQALLLSIIEFGGYPNFIPLYNQMGYEVVSAPSVRKGLALLKTMTPDIIVAEFNFQSDFRDRTSSLESLLAVVQRNPQTRVIVFYEREVDHQLDKLRARFPIYQTLAFPIETAQFEACLRQVAAEIKK